LQLLVEVLPRFYVIGSATIRIIRSNQHSHEARKIQNKEQECSQELSPICIFMDSMIGDFPTLIAI